MDISLNTVLLTNATLCGAFAAATIGAPEMFKDAFLTEKIGCNVGNYVVDSCLRESGFLYAGFGTACLLLTRVCEKKEEYAKESKKAVCTAVGVSAVLLGVNGILDAQKSHISTNNAYATTVLSLLLGALNLYVGLLRSEK